MIVGHGLLASAFRTNLWDDTDTVVFASGVSNSKETRPEEFRREENLLDEYLGGGRRIYYFGSCSVLDPTLEDAPYVRHKLRMEEKVRAAARYVIFRLPQVVGRSENPNLLTNFLFEKIKSGTQFQLWKNARRNLIDVDDVASIAIELAKTEPDCTTYNLASTHSISVEEIALTFERILKKKASYSTVDAGGDYEIKVEEVIIRAAKSMGVHFNNDYANKILEKYYG